MIDNFIPLIHSIWTDYGPWLEDDDIDDIFENFLQDKLSYDEIKRLSEALYDTGREIGFSDLFTELIIFSNWRIIDFSIDLIYDSVSLDIWILSFVLKDIETGKIRACLNQPYKRI